MPNRYLLRELVTLVCIHCGPIPCRPRARINVTRYPWRKKTTQVLLYYRDAPGFRPDSPSFFIRYPAGYRKQEQLNTYRYLVSKRPDIRQIIQLGSIETKKIREMEKILPNMHSMVQREQTKSCQKLERCVSLNKSFVQGKKNIRISGIWHLDQPVIRQAGKPAKSVNKMLIAYKVVMIIELYYGRNLDLVGVGAGSLYGVRLLVEDFLSRSE